MGFAVRTQGAEPGIRAHPHVVLWHQVGGLVYDGVLYTKARVSGKQHQDSGAEAALSEPLASEATDAGAPPLPAPPAAVAPTTSTSGGSDSDDDSLVE